MAALRVDIADLLASASLASQHADDLRDAFDRSDATLDEVRSGWVGDSAQVLGEVAARWSDFAARAVSSCVEHAQRLHENAGMYDQQEQRTAAEISAWAHPLNLD